APRYTFLLPPPLSIQVDPPSNHFSYLGSPPSPQSLPPARPPIGSTRHDSKPIPCRGFVQTAVSKARPPGLPRCSEVIPPARSRYSTNVYRSKSGFAVDLRCDRTR